MSGNLPEKLDQAVAFQIGRGYLYLALLYTAVVIGARLIVHQIDGAPVGPIVYSLNALVTFVAACACVWRGYHEPGAYLQGWLALAATLFIATVATLYQLTMGLMGQFNVNAAVDLILLALSLVPLIFILASPQTHAPIVRLFDALASVALAGLFYLSVSAILLPGEQLDDRGVNTLIWMYDSQNLFLTLFAALRLAASRSASARNFFAGLLCFALVYWITSAIINRFVRGGAVGGGWDILYDLPGFAVVIAVTCVSLRDVSYGRGSGFVRTVEQIVPFVLPLSLLTLSLIVAFHNVVLAIIGSVAAMGIYGVRMGQAVLHSMAERDSFAKISSVDALTGLPNRRQFDASFADEISRARRIGAAARDPGGQPLGLAVVMIDIDHFKLLNDRLGHQIGDDRLRAVGQGLLSFAARTGDVVARYGGEEFVAILPNVRADLVLLHANAICDGIRALNLPTPAPLGVVTVSVGVAWTADSNMLCGEDLLQCADQALYASKNAGRNRATAFWEIQDPPQVETQPHLVR